MKFLPQIYKLSLLLICMLCSNSLFATEVSVNIGDYAAANSWKDATKYESIALDANVTASVTGTSNTGKYYVSGKQWRIYQNENPTLTISTTSGTLSSVTVTYVVEKGGVLLNGSTSVASGTAVSASGSSITFKVGNSGTATNGQVRVTAISVEYTVGGGGDTPTLEESDLALTPSALSFDLFNNSDAQVINYTTSSTGAVTVSESDYVETVVNPTAKTITVTPKKKTPSEQTITVSQAADENYYAGTVDFTVSIANSAPYVQPTSVSITPNYSFWGKNEQFSGSTYDNLSGEKDNVSLSWVRGGGSTYANQNAMRFYKENTLTFTAPMGYQITEIKFDDATFKGDETFSVGTLSGTTWSGKATEVTMSRPSGASGYATINKITITLQEIIPLVLSSIDLSGDYPTTFHQGDTFSHEGLVVTANYDDETSADVTASATFSEPDMTTVGEKTVTVSYTEGEVTKTADYTINVNAPAELLNITLSGNCPTEFEQGDAFSYEGLVVTANYSDETSADVTADAEFSGYDMSALGVQTVTVSYQGQTVTYNITIVEKKGTADNPYTVAQARAAIDANEGVTVEGAYVKGIISQVDTYNSKYHSITYWISEDGTTANQLQVYSGLGLNGADFSSKKDVQVGDKVVVSGKLKKFNSTYEFDYNNELVSLERANFITDAANATWVAPAKVKVLSEGVQVYTVTYDDAVRCTRKHVVADKVIPANEAVLLTSNSKGEATTVKIAVTNDAATDYEALKAALKNDLQGSDGTVWGDTNIFCLADGAKGLGFYPVDSSIQVPAGKAYLEINLSDAQAEGAPKYLWFNGDTTAIDSLTTDTAADNESGEIYSLTGQRVGKNYRGIVIMNGRKVLKK